MRRAVLLLTPLALALAAGAVALWPRPLVGQGGKDPGAAPAARQADPRLPITRVVLFTSGVAFFQREGEVEGDAAIDLTFPVGDINDLLKSLVLRDHGGGQIQAVGYDSHDPVEKSLRAFAIDFSKNPGLADILHQARGEKVEVSAPNVSQLKIAGTLVGVERRKEPVSKDAVAEVDHLNLLTAGGLRNIPLAEVKEVRFVSATLDAEVRRALDVLARSHDTQKKTVTIHFRGQDKRRVSVGYVAEHPVWRASYRLVLNSKAKPYLQGWAQVENPTAEDWKGVGVRLVSGRPVSFRMDLYEPLYAERPLVELERYANLRPRAYESTFGRVGRIVGGADDAKTPSSPMADSMLSGGGKKGAKDRGAAPGEQALKRLEDARHSLEESVVAQADAGRVGDSFFYEVKQPLTLARQKSSLVPIVAGDVGGDRVSIYTAGQQSAHPMLGLKLKNTTGLHLMQGPITVFDGNAYAGDALIRDVRPGEERLLSYALDQAMEVKTERKKEPEKLVEIRIRSGTVERTVRLRDAWKYTVKNASDADRVLVIEHPSRLPEWKLVTPAKQPPTTGSETYRFEVRVPAGKEVAFPVVEERDALTQVALTNADDDALALLVQTQGASAEFKAAVRKAVDLKAKWSTTLAEVKATEAKLRAQTDDQARMRENMKVIPQSDPAYRKYLDQFLAIDQAIASLRKDVERLQTLATRQRQEYERFVANLTVKEGEQ